MGSGISITTNSPPIYSRFKGLIPIVNKILDKKYDLESVQILIRELSYTYLCEIRQHILNHISCYPKLSKQDFSRLTSILHDIRELIISHQERSLRIRQNEPDMQNVQNLQNLQNQ
jgi:hypothetical protein